MQQTFATCKPLIGPGGLFAAKLTLYETSRCAPMPIPYRRWTASKVEVSRGDLGCRRIRLRHGLRKELCDDVTSFATVVFNDL